MSITRKALVAMGIENEKAEQLLDMHLETVNKIRETLENFGLQELMQHVEKMI